MCLTRASVRAQPQREGLGGAGPSVRPHMPTTGLRPRTLSGSRGGGRSVCGQKATSRGGAAVVSWLSQSDGSGLISVHTVNDNIGEHGIDDRIRQISCPCRGSIAVADDGLCSHTHWPRLSVSCSGSCFALYAHKHKLGKR